MQDARIVPHHADAEKSMLGSMLLSHNAAAEADDAAGAQAHGRGKERGGMGKVKTPFADNPLFRQSCEICEAYCGEEHLFGECTKCPIWNIG